MCNINKYKGLSVISQKQNIYHKPILCVKYVISLFWFWLLFTTYFLGVILVLIIFFLSYVISYSNFVGSGEIFLKETKKKKINLSTPTSQPSR